MVWPCGRLLPIASFFFSFAHKFEKKKRRSKLFFFAKQATCFDDQGRQRERMTELGGLSSLIRASFSLIFFWHVPT